MYPRLQYHAELFLCSKNPPSLSSTPGYHWSLYCFHNFAFSKMSYSWNHSVCSLFRLSGLIHLACITFFIGNKVTKLKTVWPMWPATTHMGLQRKKVYITFCHSKYSTPIPLLPDFLPLALWESQGCSHIPHCSILAPACLQIHEQVFLEPFPIPLHSPTHPHCGADGILQAPMDFLGSFHLWP